MNAQTMSYPSASQASRPLKGLVTYSVRQSLTSFASSRPEFAKLGVELDLLKLDPSRIRTVPGTLQLLAKVHFGQLDFIILNSGILWLRKPALLAHVLKVLKRRGIPVFVLWRNAASKFAEIRGQHGDEAVDRAMQQMRDPVITHLAISDATARDVAAGVGCSLPTNILNCRAISEHYLDPVAPEEPPIVLNVASVIARKGPDIFTDVAIATCQAHPTVRFWWLGGEAPPEEQARIDAAGFADRIVFKRFDPDPFSYMRKASVFLLTSREEGFGLVLAEAMAVSRTVISFAGTGAAEVAGDTGFVVPNGDVAATSKAVLSAIEPAAEQRINLAARERYLALYSPAAYAARLTGIVRAAIDADGVVAAPEAQG